MKDKLTIVTGEIANFILTIVGLLLSFQGWALQLTLINLVSAEHAPPMSFFASLSAGIPALIFFLPCVATTGYLLLYRSGFSNSRCHLALISISIGLALFSVQVTALTSTASATWSSPSLPNINGF